MSNFYIDLPTGGSAPGLLSINGDTTADQVIAGASGIAVATSGGTTTITGVGLGVTVHTVTNGETYTTPNNTPSVVLNSGGLIAAQTTLLPGSPIAGQVVTYSCVGGGITAWTLTPTAGSSFFPSAPSTIAVGQSYSFVYVVLGPTHYWVKLVNSNGAGSYLPLTGGTLSGNLTMSGTGNQLIQSAFDSSAAYKVQLNESTAPYWALQTYNSDTSAGIYLWGQQQNATPVSTDIIGGVSGAAGDLITGDVAGRVGLGTNTTQSVTSVRAVVQDSSVSNGSAFVAADIDASAVLEARSGSTPRGFLTARVADHTTISAPAEGLLSYNTTNHKLYFYNGTVWKEVATV